VDRPEILSTIEWQNIVYFKNSRFSVDIYQENLRNFISWFGPHTNVGDFDGYGIELELVNQFSDNLSLWGNASFNQSELVPFGVYVVDINDPIDPHHIVIDEDNRIIGAPEIIVNTGFDLRVGGSINLSSEIRYFTKQPAYDPAANKFVSINNRYYLDASIIYSIPAKTDIDIRLSARNLLDLKWDLSS
jgi:hypothetical protein